MLTNMLLEKNWRGGLYLLRIGLDLYEKVYKVYIRENYKKLVYIKNMSSDYYNPKIFLSPPPTKAASGASIFDPPEDSVFNTNYRGQVEGTSYGEKTTGPLAFAGGGTEGG